MSELPGYFKIRDLAASVRCLSKGEIAAFEREFASYVGVKYALGTSYGRTALYLGLRAIGVEGGEVIIPSFICTVVRHAVAAAGATPRFVDVVPGEWVMDVDDLKGKLSSRTKAVVLPHYFGRVARNLEEITAIAKGSGVALVEDCAHALDAEYMGKKVGTFGHFSIFSLTKSMVNCGGGVLVTDDEEICRRARGVLDGRVRPWSKRVADFPIVAAYGLEQAIDKMVFDRVGPSVFKWWAMSLPHALLQARQGMICLAKLPLRLRTAAKRRDVVPVLSGGGGAETPYQDGIRMEPIMASLGRRQLRRIDSMVSRKREIVDELAKLGKNAVKPSNGFPGKDVYTHAPLRFPKTDIFEVVKRCKNRGLFLRPTWPTHQNVWEEQDTPNLRAIEREVLIWNVSPSSTQREVHRFTEILDEYQYQIL